MGYAYSLQGPSGDGAEVSVQCSLATTFLKKGSPGRLTRACEKYASSCYPGQPLLRRLALQTLAMWTLPPGLQGFCVKVSTHGGP